MHVHTYTHTLHTCVYKRTSTYIYMYKHYLHALTKKLCKIALMFVNYDHLCYMYIWNTCSCMEHTEHTHTYLHTYTHVDRLTYVQLYMLL